jgi:hypothetical protein
VNPAARKTRNSAALWHAAGTLAASLCLLIGFAHGLRRDYAAGAYFLTMALLMLRLRDEGSA